MFITFEGIEGCGKSTHLRRVSEWLKAVGVAHRLTREPGGTATGEAIRALLVNQGTEAIDPLCELFLYLADRRQHVAQVLAPGLARGELILCDRYADATFAYQGLGRGLDLALLGQLNATASGKLTPTLTLLFDCPPEEGLLRARRRADNLAEGSEREDRFEMEDLEFHRRVRRGYLDLAALEPDRWRIIDSSVPFDAVREQVRRILAPVLGLAAGGGDT
ncbi:MAG: dTMP kinase [Pseudomonadota bacterium]